MHSWCNFFAVQLKLWGGQKILSPRYIFIGRGQSPPSPPRGIDATANTGRTHAAVLKEHLHWNRRPAGQYSTELHRLQWRDSNLSSQNHHHFVGKDGTMHVAKWKDCISWFKTMTIWLPTDYYYYYTHTHTHPFNGPFSKTTRVSRYQKGKTNLDFTEARDSEWQWHQLGHMQVCTSLHASTSPLSFLQAGCPSCRSIRPLP